MLTHPQAIPLVMITMRKSTHLFPFLSYMSMGLCMAAHWATRAPLSKVLCEKNHYKQTALSCKQAVRGDNNIKEIYSSTNPTYIGIRLIVPTNTCRIYSLNIEVTYRLLHHVLFSLHKDIRQMYKEYHFVRYS